MNLSTLVTETVDEALGKSHREDPVVGGSGGPAGNARLTAWTGAVLFVLFAIEGVTLLGLRSMITWHIAVGVLLIPLVLLKTVSTGWRIARYYTGNRAYREAGPPPTVMRLLGPVVVVASIAVVGSGLALVHLGQAASRRSLLGTGGRGLDAVSIHKAAFAVWLVVMAVHVIGRLAPLRRLLRPSRPTPAVPGRSLRALTLAMVAATAVVSAVLVLGAVPAWHVKHEDHEGRHARHSAGR